MKPKQSDLLEEIIYKLIEATEKDIKIEVEHLNNVAKDVISKYEINDNNRIALCQKLFKKSSAITELVLASYHDLLEDYFVVAQWNIEDQIKSDTKQFYTVKEIVAMSNIFNMKTENTVGKKLNTGKLKGNLVNGSWQISREALIEFVGHDKF